MTTCVESNRCIKPLHSFREHELAADGANDVVIFQLCHRRIYLSVYLSSIYIEYHF